MTEKLGICLILTLNKIKTIWSFKKPSAVSKWRRRWDGVKKLTDMGEEAIWVFLREGAHERERGYEVERDPPIFRFCFWLLYTDLAYR